MSEQRESTPSEPQGWQVHRCTQCGRIIRDPESIARGSGPDCWEALSASEAEDGEDTQDDQDEEE